jgi:hypothetical protein
VAAAANAGRAVSGADPAGTGHELMMVAEAAKVTVEPLDDGCWAIKIADGGSVVRFRMPRGQAVETAMDLLRRLELATFQLPGITYNQRWPL